MDQLDQSTPLPALEPTPDANAGTVGLSSNATLFWRIFIPVFGTVFVTGLLLAYWLIDPNDLYTSLPVIVIRLMMLGIWLLWLLLVWKTIWKLKRLDANEQFLFVTNYWVSVRYPWSDIEKIESFRRAGRSLRRIHLKAPGRFGRTMVFLPGRHFSAWMEEHGKSHLLS
jgi:hypothetical protein